MHINPSEAGLTVKQFLRQKLLFSMHQISRVKYRPEGITVNGEPRWVNAVLRAGDVLRIRLDDAPAPDDAPALGRTPAADSAPEPRPEGRAAAAPEPVVSADARPAAEIPVLFEDDFLLIADKPAGTVSHPSHGHHGDSALDLLEAKHGRLYLIGRLDKDTSGVLLFAKHVETASLLSRAKKNGLIQKQYMARIRGCIDPPEGSIDVPIGTAQEFPLKMQADPESGKSAVTHYRTVLTDRDENGEAYSILSIRIDHGRTHQIRVHLGFAGHPLEGDALYGGHGAVDRCPGESAPADRFPGACLHAASVTLTHPYTGEELFVRASEPAWCAGSCGA